METGTNSFGVRKQYRDGFGLTVYVKGDPINNKDNWGLESACCKIKETQKSYDYMPMYGGMGRSIPTTKTICKQVTIAAGEMRPIVACKCYYKNNPNVKIYGAKKGECE